MHNELNFHTIPVLVINLPHRHERLIRCKNELNKLFGYNKDFTLINGVVDESPMIGIAKAHQKAIQFAKKNKMQNVIIVEDDLQVFDSSLKYAEQAFLNAPDNFDILLGCCYTGEPKQIDNEYWNKQSGHHSALIFYCINEKIYDTMLNFKYTQHIDAFISDKFNTYLPKKFFVKQYDNELSDNTGQIVSYDQLLNKYEILK